ncbi:hypothetical protein [Nannocystis pusilla]|uniref:hypothetical protein n=1 Tax=Nannocystis pusilla TaxID=889268 RepID=UPI003DA27B0F
MFDVKAMFRVAAGIGVVVAGCGDSSGGSDCLECMQPAVIGALGDPQIRETLGIVASAAHAGVWYVHNDAGDAARLFAIADDGSLRATLTLDVPHVDWEDVARGPCPAGQCLYIGDIGDNDLARDALVVYRVAEPVQLVDSVLPAERLFFTYQDGPHDAETLLVDPQSGGITVITKVDGGDSSIYEFPLPLRPGERVVLEPAGSFQPPTGSPRITGGDVHPDGTGVLLRTRSGVYYYSKRPEDSVASALAGHGCAGPKLDEEQGEAIAWALDGEAYVSVGEGAGAALHRVGCGT